MEDYQKQANDFLIAHGLEFRAVHIGHDCPPSCEDARANRAMDEVSISLTARNRLRHWPASQAGD